MTEYETAALAISQAQLALSQAELGIMQVQVWVSAGVGTVQCVLIAWGLWRMGQASAERNRQLDAMTAALERQGEVLAELLRRSDRQAES